MSPEQPWRPSKRALRYWGAIVVVVIGVICGATIPGTLGGTICTAIVGVGLIAIVSMVFYDVGLTEDRDRERSRRRLDPDDREEPSRNGAPPHRQRPERSLRPEWLKERRRRSH
ncbi:MAG TPA: hypothetical protein VHX62_11575 [Solirubrobacteraceae bacterium]|nr:hypothetical protein [Solirubrobacteraceae bacterium]